MNQPLAQDKARPRLVLVDGSGYIFRAYHALPPLSRPDGTPVGAVLGFCNMLVKLKETIHADYLAVIFDAARITFRNEIYADYKAHRPPAPEDLVPQFAIVREATRALNIPAIEMSNYEADDIIACYAKQGVAEGMDVLVVSSDKDLMQLIADGVSLYDPMKQKPIGPEQVLEKFGVTPDKVTHVQALIGDSVDNVPGIPGIGPKTAAELINQYGTLEELLARAHEIKQPKRRESLIEYADKARISFKLVQLDCDMPLPQPLDTLEAREPESDVWLGFLREQNFNALLKKMENRGGVKTAPVPVLTESKAPAVPTEKHYELVTNEAQLLAWIAKIEAAGVVAFDTETDSLDATQAELVGISLSVTAGTACYIPLAHLEQGVAVAASQGSLFDDAPAGEATWKLRQGQLARERALELLRPVLTSPAILKIGQNIKYDMLVLDKYDVLITPVEDTMLLSYVLAAGLHGHGMDELSERYLSHKPIAYKDVVGSGKKQLSFAQVELEPARDYAAEDADVTLQLQQLLKPKVIEAKLLRVYESIERPLIPVIMAMEAAGVRADPKVLEGLSVEFAEQMAMLEQQIYQLAGHEFNIGSPKQLGEVLFDEMQLGGGKKSSKTDAYTTSADVLEELSAAGHELPARVLDWRQLAKLRSTYTEALIKQINPNTGRIHTSYSMAVAATGRLSSSDPNLQNIPIRTKEGKRIREAFIAAEGCKLISADYSQIELRLLADMANIEVLRQAFRDGADIHAATASQMFAVPMSEMTSELRRRAKSINFGIIYGISAHGLAANLGISRKEAADYIAAYFEKYPGIKAYMEATKAYAHTHGYVETLYGRRVHVKDINAANPNLRAFSERAAINAPLQGTAADIIKRAMVSVYDELAVKFPQAKLLLQVHDELIVEAPEAQAEEVAKLLKRVMQGAAHLSVPLLVEAEVGDNWGVIH